MDCYRVQLDLITDDLEAIELLLLDDERVLIYRNTASRMVELRLWYQAESYENVWRQLQKFLTRYALQPWVGCLGIGRDEPRSEKPA